MRKLMLVLSLFQLSAFADTNGISLTLYFPHTEMFDWEWCNYSITLSNGSSRAVQIIKEPRDMVRCQLIFDLDTTKPPSLLDHYYECEDSHHKWDSFKRSRQNAVPLLAGESYTWDIFFWDGELRSAIEQLGATSMVVRCILDANTWVKSNTVQVKLYPKETLVPVFDEKTTPRFERLYKAKLGNQTYLFNELKERICELPDDDIPNIQRNPDEGSISISFPKSRRRILYNVERANWKTE
ncbi:MAG: hypothetical protein FWG50_12105 [Kiritimatiellaeota bacterium]|nr:hypothetical protein [Kiritimatiellota bacterium]